MAEKFKFKKEIIDNLNILIGQNLQEMGLSADETEKEKLRKEIEDLEKKRTRYLEDSEELKGPEVKKEIKPTVKRAFVSQTQADFLEARPKEHAPGILAKESVLEDALEYKEKLKALEARKRMKIEREKIIKERRELLDEYEEDKRGVDKIQIPSEKPAEEQETEEIIISGTEKEKQLELELKVKNEAIEYLISKKGLSEENAKAALTPERIQKLVKLAKEKQKI